MTRRSLPALVTLLVSVFVAATLLLAAPDADAKRRKRRKRPATPTPTAVERPAPAPTPAPPDRPRTDPTRPDRPQPGIAIEAAEPVSVPGTGYGRRIEFDALTVLGQTKAAGAVYLFERQRSDLHSMVERRRSYREALRRELEERRRP